MSSMVRSILLVVWLCAVGCVGIDRVPVEVSDSDARSLQGRVSIDVTPRPKGLLPEGGGLIDDYDDGFRVSSGFEGEFQYSEIRGRQQTTAGQILQISDGVAFAGPATVVVESDVSNVILNARFGVLFLETARLSILGGLQFSELSVRLTQGSQRDRQHVTSIGPTWGARADLFLFEWASVYAQVRASGMYGDADYDTDERKGREVGVTLTPHPRLGISAGYRWAELDLGSDDRRLLGFSSRRSDIELDWEGGFVGMEIRF